MRPGVCKQFYETGYCVFGEGCKFLHQRAEAHTAVSRAEPVCNACKCVLTSGDTAVPACGHRVCLGCLERSAGKCVVCGAAAGEVDIE